MPGQLSENGRAYSTGAVVEKISAETRAEWASIHVRDDDGGYSIIVVPRALGRALSIGDRVTFAVGAMVEPAAEWPCHQVGCEAPRGHTGAHVGGFPLPAGS